MKQVYLQFPQSTQLKEFVNAIYPFNVQEDDRTIFAVLSELAIELAVNAFDATVVSVL